MSTGQSYEQLVRAAFSKAIWERFRREDVYDENGKFVGYRWIEKGID